MYRMIARWIEMRNEDNHTPKEVAYMVAVDWLEAAYRGATSDLQKHSGTPSFDKEVKKQIAKLHDQLQGRMKFDGSFLSED